MTKDNHPLPNVYNIIADKIDELKDRERSGDLLSEKELDLLISLTAFRMRSVISADPVQNDFVLVNTLLRGKDDETKICIYRSFIIEILLRGGFSFDPPVERFYPDEEDDDRELILDLLRSERLTVIPEHLLGSIEYIEKAASAQPKAFQNAYDLKTEDRWEDAQRKRRMAEAISDSDPALCAMSQAGLRVFSDFHFMEKLVAKNPMAIRFADMSLQSKDCFEEIAEIAVKKCGSAIQYVPERFRTDELIIEAAKDPKSNRWLPKEIRESKSYIYHTARQGGQEMLKWTSEELRNDRGLVLGLLGYGVDFLAFAGDTIRCDRGIASVAVAIDPAALKYFCEEIRSDRNLIEKCIERGYKGALILLHAAEQCRSDKNLAMKAVRKSGIILKNLSEELKKDPQIVLEAIKDNPAHFEFADIELINDPAFVEEAFRVNPEIIVVEQVLQPDRKRELLLEAIRQNASTLGRAPKKYREDIFFCQEAIRVNPDSYGFLPRDFQEDYGFRKIAYPKGGASMCGSSFRKGVCPSLALAALASGKISRRNLSFLTSQYEEDREMLLKILECSGSTFYRFSRRMREDREIAMKAVQYTGLNLEHVEGDLKEDRELVVAAVRRTGQAIVYAPKEMRAEKDLVLEAYECRDHSLSRMEAPAIFSSISMELRQDEDVIRAAIDAGENVLEDNLWEIRSDREIVLECVRRNGQLLQYATMGLRSSRQIVLEAVENNGMALKYASEELRMDRKVVLAAVSSDSDAMEFALGETIKDRKIAMKLNEYQYLDDSLRDDRIVAKHLLRCKRRNFSEMSERLQQDAAIQEEFIRCWAVDGECMVEEKNERECLRGD